ncbi:MAG: hypothetical protein CVU69_10320 [Deltaproteobacteria bacterium HGW-Deltaproteobacteria-4]|nr:MAG: hypothetical protein CVU69_10320 [Deltaproteobacteria bacterium HGW-Deltaproteobacteria-4]
MTVSVKQKNPTIERSRGDVAKGPAAMPEGVNYFFSTGYAKVGRGTVVDFPCRRCRLAAAMRTLLMKKRAAASFQILLDYDNFMI